MLRPTPGLNPTRDRAWYGVLTWIQPKEEVQPGDIRLVRRECRCGSQSDLVGSARFSGSILRRTWNILSRQAISRKLKSALFFEPRRQIPDAGTRRLREHLEGRSARTAWVSTHYSDEALESIISQFVFVLRDVMLTGFDH